MIMDLVVEAVEIKLHFENFTGVLQSDYEFGYALGRMMKILGLPEEDEFSLDTMQETMKEKMSSYEPKDSIEKNLIKLIREYRIQHQSGEEILLLYHRGYNKE